MTCQDKLFINKANDILFPIRISKVTKLPVIDINDIVDMTITLTLSSNELTSTSFTKSAGGIIINSTQIILLILQTSISIAGIYNVKIDWTDISGKDRGNSSCPESLEFHTQ